VLLHHKIVEVETKLLYTVVEAAEQLSLSRAQVYRLIDSRQLKSVTVGRSRRITLAQLQSFLQELEYTADQQALRLRASLGRRSWPRESFEP
jgi:excisionase family DNA binding protein